MKKTAMIVLLALIGVAGISAQAEYRVTGIRHLGDFEDAAPRNGAISQAVAAHERQNPGLTFTETNWYVHFELKTVAQLYETEIPEDASIDSLWAVFVTPNQGLAPANEYIIFYEFQPFAVNPYIFWVYRGSRR